MVSRTLLHTVSDNADLRTQISIVEGIRYKSEKDGYLRTPPKHEQTAVIYGRRAWTALDQEVRRDPGSRSNGHDHDYHSPIAV